MGLLNNRLLIMGLLVFLMGAAWVLLAYCFRRMVDLAPNPRRRLLLFWWAALLIVLPLFETWYFNLSFADHSTYGQHFVRDLLFFSAVPIGWCWSVIRARCAIPRESS